MLLLMFGITLAWYPSLIMCDVSVFQSWKRQTSRRHLEYVYRGEVFYTVYSHVSSQSLVGFCPRDSCVRIQLLYVTRLIALLICEVKYTGTHTRVVVHYTGRVFFTHVAWYPSSVACVESVYFRSTTTFTFTIVSTNRVIGMRGWCISTRSRVYVDWGVIDRE
jgi:hypothetical protein